jgi:hypothetical protein
MSAMMHPPGRVGVLRLRFSEPSMRFTFMPFIAFMIALLFVEAEEERPGISKCEGIYRRCYTLYKEMRVDSKTWVGSRPSD